MCGISSGPEYTRLMNVACWPDAEALEDPWHFWLLGLSGRSRVWHVSTRLPSRPGEFHPEPLTDPDLNLSIHPARVTARRLPPSVVYRAPPAVGCPTSVDPIQRRGPASFAPRALPPFIATTNQSAPPPRIGTFRLPLCAACTFSLCISRQVLTFPTKAPLRFA